MMNDNDNDCLTDALNEDRTLVLTRVKLLRTGIGECGGVEETMLLRCKCDGVRRNLVQCMCTACACRDVMRREMRG